MTERGELAQTHVEYRTRLGRGWDNGGRGRVTHSSVKRCPKWGQSALAFCVTERSFTGTRVCVCVFYIQGCVAAVVLCFIFSLFYFFLLTQTKAARSALFATRCSAKLMWTHPALFVCFPACILRLMNQLLPFTQVTKHKLNRTESNRTETKSTGRGLHLRENQRQSNTADTPKTGHRHRVPAKDIRSRGWGSQKPAWLNEKTVWTTRRIRNGNRPSPTALRPTGRMSNFRYPDANPLRHRHWHRLLSLVTC